MPSEKILVVDDEENTRYFLRRLLQEEGYEVETERDGRGAVEKATSEDFDLVLCDLRMPGVGGMAVLEQLRELRPQASIVMMTAFASIKSAVEAIRGGAHDYLTKPFRADEVLKTVKQALEQQRLRTELSTLRREVERKYSFHNIIGKSKALHDLFALIEKVANSRASVLITGETGTGKELLAKAMHYQSNRRQRPFVPVNCGAIPEGLQEREFFGHLKGTFTDARETKKGLFEEADGGTLFLDEVEALPPPLQVKLLRTLQDGEVRRLGDTRTIKVDVRIIAAANRDLQAEVRQRTFREDFYFRLNVVPLRIPPLRERREDIPLLANHFLARYSRESGKALRGINPRGMDMLLTYQWPGNVRELENLIERAVLIAEGETLDANDLFSDVQLYNDEIRIQLPESLGSLPDTIKRITQSIERELILTALMKTDYNRTQAARLLGISRRSLLYKIQEHTISLP